MKCPGQDTQYWKSGAIFEVPCPQCNAPVEFFKDDTTRKCSRCGHRFVNPRLDFGCAAYCPYAAECLGTLPPELLAEREDLLKDRVAVEMKRFYGSDFRRIGRATRAGRYAEAIGREEKGNVALVLMAAYLHGMNREEARTLLEKLGAPAPLVAGVLEMIAAIQAENPPADVEGKIVGDACRLAQMEDHHKAEPMDVDTLEGMIASEFHTESGRRTARFTLMGASA